jgi:hypothetical protein
MNSTDSASLQNLNDIVLPADVSCWPLATGWYFLSGLLLFFLVWFGYRSIRRLISNRYRREALHELQLLSENMQDENYRDTSLRKIPVLLKRTALSAYPRSQVASLTGKDWHQFLNSKLKSPLFTGSIAGTLDTVSYSAGQLSDVDAGAAKALLKASRHWLKDHQAPSASDESKES